MKNPYESPGVAPNKVRRGKSPRWVRALLWTGPVLTALGALLAVGGHFVAFLKVSHSSQPTPQGLASDLALAGSLSFIGVPLFILGLAVTVLAVWLWAAGRSRTDD